MYVARSTGRARCHSTDALDHLARRAPREGEQQNAMRIGAVGEEARDAATERLGLPRPRAGDDQERPIAMLNGLTLSLIQAAIDIIDSGTRTDSPHPLR